MVNETTLERERRSLGNFQSNHYFIPSSYQAYRLLYWGYTAIPLLAGADKFLNFLVNWSIYLSPKVTALGIDADSFMRLVGVIEIAAGLLVAFKPKAGGLVVALWLMGIVINLLSIPGFYDIALRDFALAMGALALSRLSLEFQQYRKVLLKRWDPLSTEKAR